MKKHLFWLCVLAFSASLHVTAQSFKLQISAHPELSANNYLAYPTPSGNLLRQAIFLCISRIMGDMDRAISFMRSNIFDRLKHLNGLILLGF